MSQFRRARSWGSKGHCSSSHNDAFSGGSNNSMPQLDAICRVVNTIFTAFELFADRLISWMPLYWEAKILFVCWLTLPAFRGASVLYHSVVQRYLEHYEPDIDRHLEAAGAKIGEIADGVRGTVALHVRQKSGLIFSAASQLVADAAAAAASAGSGSGAPGSGSAAAAPGQQHAVQPKRNSIGSQQRKGRSPKS